MFFARVFLLKIFYTDFLLCDANVAKYLVKIKERDSSNNAPNGRVRTNALSTNSIAENSEKATTLSKKDGAQFSLKETNDKSVVEKSHKMKIKGYLNLYFLGFIISRQKRQSFCVQIDLQFLHGIVRRGRVFS